MDTKSSTPTLRTHRSPGRPRPGDRPHPAALERWRPRRAPEEPVAVDAERASSYRQLPRLSVRGTEAAGTAPLDPLVSRCRHAPHALAAGMVSDAAGQDLPSPPSWACTPDPVRHRPLSPTLGMERGGSAPSSRHLGLRLAKEHSAADWSKRPLPESWLVYAALDVEVLVQVRDVLQERLETAGKAEWAQQEFAHESTREHGPTRSASWRGLHGLGSLRTAKQLAAAREMWTRRDELASGRISPHRVIRDRDLVAAAKEAPRGREASTGRRRSSAQGPVVAGRTRRYRAARRTRAVRGIPAPQALVRSIRVAERYQLVRAAVNERAEDLEMPPRTSSSALLRQWGRTSRQGPRRRSSRRSRPRRPSLAGGQTAPVIHRALVEAR